MNINNISPEEAARIPVRAIQKTKDAAGYSYRVNGQVIASTGRNLSGPAYSLYLKVDEFWYERKGRLRRNGYCKTDENAQKTIEKVIRLWYTVYSKRRPPPIEET